MDRDIANEQRLALAAAHEDPLGSLAHLAENALPNRQDDIAFVRPDIDDLDRDEPQRVHHEMEELAAMIAADFEPDSAGRAEQLARGFNHHAGADESELVSELTDVHGALPS